jgi:hypothetical protein
MAFMLAVVACMAAWLFICAYISTMLSHNLEGGSTMAALCV